MVDFGTALSVAQSLFATLECSLIKEVCAISDYETDLEGLKRTVTTIKSALVDAGNKAEFSQTDLNYIQKLKDAVYDADDLFDRFLTIVARKQNGSLSDKVRLFFSFENPFKVAHSIFRDVKKIRNHLDAIADDLTKFGFSFDTQLLRRRREETCSYVYANDVVGRDADATKVIHRLLDSTENVGFVTIVGIGGLGKTTLARLIFCDERIIPEFSVRMWVCVADQDEAQLNVKEILSKMLELVGCQVDNNSTTEKVQTEYQSKLGGKKFLLVLDDMWTENVLEWHKLRGFLMIGGKGSRIIVTTRSKETARIIGNGMHTNIHDLKGLSKIDSWRLFEMSAFEKGTKCHDFDEIGKKIVEKCYNLPLAIKVVGSLLYGHPIDKWQTFESNGFAEISNGDNEVMSILKFSYDHLEPSLKSCFTYCAIFPKDFVIDKEMLLSLWEAQGYIVPFDKGQSIENAGEEHFSILVKRCFFQDVKYNEYGEVESFKIHDLMHDLAQRVSKNEISVINSSMFNPKSIGRHLFESKDDGCEINYLMRSKIRSYLWFSRNYASISMGKMAKNWACLRALSMDRLVITSLPETMGNLLHLRYLNLSNSYITILPNSIVKLHNLQTLNLNNCSLLKEWPKKFDKLVNLTHLYIQNCYSLKNMPANMSKLNSLRVLSTFLVSNESVNGRRRVGQLRDLKALAVNLKGRLCIDLREIFVSSVSLTGRITTDLREYFLSAEECDLEGSYLEGAKHLQEVLISFSLRGGDEDEAREEAIIEKLQPHPNLKKFGLTNYKGNKIGQWGGAHNNWITFLPNLVHIELQRCDGLQELPMLSYLRHLKYLRLEDLWNLEYIEEEVASSRDSGSPRLSESKITFFPSLEFLYINNCEMLKGWWRGDCSIRHFHLAFLRLSRLYIRSCSKLISFPLCPNLRELELDGNNRALRITTTNEGHLSSSFSPAHFNGNLSLGQDKGNSTVNFKVDHVAHLKALKAQFLTSLCIHDDDVESLVEVEEMLKGCSFSLRSLIIFTCPKLTSLCGGLEHLTALHSLSLHHCEVLKLEEEDQCNDMPWRALHSNLRSLKLNGLTKVEKLPMGMQCLTSLQHLQIDKCPNLKALPEWISCFKSLQTLRIDHCGTIKSLPQSMVNLTSLQKLEIERCPYLKESCKEPNGHDWPKIQHVPQINLN